MNVEGIKHFAPIRSAKCQDITLGIVGKADDKCHTALLIGSASLRLRIVARCIIVSKSIAFYDACFRFGRAILSGWTTQPLRPGPKASGATFTIWL